MRRVLVALAVLAGLLLTPLAVLAANTSATIVRCVTATACYSPDPIRITVGSTVTWTNSHTLTHTATADSGAWDTGALAPGATSGPITFSAAGTFAYHCRFHSDMHGTIIVSAVAATPTPTAAPVRRLAQGGGGPAAPPAGPTVPIALGLVLAGLVLLATHPRRRAGARATRRAASDEAPR